MKQKRVFSFILVMTMLISMFQGVLPVVGAEKTTETVDASASNWTPVNLTSSDVTGGASFSGNADTFGTGTTLNTKLDVTEAVEFDFRFTEENMATDSLFAITFGVDADSFNNGAKGTTFIMYKKAANVIQCGQGGGEWREYTHTSVYTYRFVKEADGWALYLKGAGSDQTDIQLGKISFDAFAADEFANGEATLGIYVYDATNTTNELAFEVTNVKYMFTEEDTEKPVVKTMMSVDGAYTNWTPVYLTGSDIEGGASFAGNAGAFGTGTTLNTKLDVTEAVEFDFKFTEENMATDSLFAITFGVDEDSFNNGAKGTTFIMYKKAANVIQCGQGGGEWREYTHTSVYTYRFVKEADGWALYLKGAGSDQTDIQLGKISFDAFAADGFSKGEATLGIYVYDATNTTNELAFEVTNVKHMVAVEKTMIAVDGAYANWTPVYLAGSDIEGGASFAGNAGAFGTGTTLNTKLDVTEAVEFDFKFTEENMATDSLFAITFGVDADSFNNGAKGTTFIMYKKAANVIQCGQGGGEWREYTYTSVYTYRFVKEADGWALYLKGAGADQTDIQLGKIGFDAFAADGFANEEAILGIYVYDATNATNELSFEVTNIKHMTVEKEDEGGETGPVLDAYDLETYTIPYWMGDTVYNESVMILKNQDGSIPAVQLLYPATEIISVRSSDLKTEYVKGTDWDIENEKLVILENSSVPFMTYEEYYPNRTGSDILDTLDGKKIYFTEGSFFHSKQIAVTYKHTANWSWSVPEYKGTMMPKTIEKLQNNEALKIVFYGDSITTGANSSSKVGAAPYAATWMTMFEESLKKAYSNENITSVNTAVGGMTSGWGVENVQERVVNHNPDLLVVGFGMNDGNGSAVSPEVYKNNINSIIQAAKAGNPDVEVLLVSPMLPNPEVKMTDGNQASYEAQLRLLEAEGISLAPVTTMYKYLMMNKRYYDMTGNNVNHPNDFAVRLYAQTLNAVMIESETVEEVLYPENTYVLTSNEEYWDCVNHSSVLDGVITLDANGLVNYTGSKLKNDLAQFDVEAVIPAEKWVGFMAKQSNTGASPWEENCYLVIIKDYGEVQLLKCKDGAMDVIATSSTDAVQNGVLSKTTVRFGVLTEEEGARIVLDIAGVNILNYVDKNEAIITDGYTGFITLDTATAKIYAGNKGLDPNESEDKVEPILYPEATYELIGNEAYWQLNESGSISNGTVTLDSVGIANYFGSKLDNKLAQFDLDAEIPGDTWVGFMAKQSKAGASPWEQECYLVIVKDSGEVQLLKSVAGQFVQLAGSRTPAVKNGVLERATVRFGVLVEENGARIVFAVAGKNLINYLDTENPYTESGYTGFLTLDSATAKIYCTGEPEADEEKQGSGYTGGTINPDYVVDWPQIEDYIYAGDGNPNRVHVDEIADSIDVKDIVAKIKSNGSVDVVIALTETPVIDSSILDALTGRDKHFIIRIVDEEGNILSNIDYYGMDLKSDSEDNVEDDTDGKQDVTGKPGKDEPSSGAGKPNTENSDTEEPSTESDGTESPKVDTEQDDTEKDVPAVDDDKNTQSNDMIVIILLILIILAVCLFAVLMLLYLKKINENQESEAK